MVARFIRYCFLLSLLIAAGLALYILLSRPYIPAPRLSANVALNEQIHRIAKRSPHSARILALGSSMTLNNLASGPVTEFFGTQDYVNAGAWGMGASETAFIGPELVKHLRPSTVIMVMNLMDFMPGVPLTEGDRNAVGHHLSNGGSEWDHLRYWDAPWFLRQMSLNRIRFTDPGNYEFLGFDAFGGATLEVPENRILASRFNQAPPKAADLLPTSYANFADFSSGLRKQNIDLIVLLSPYREGLQDPELHSLSTLHAQGLREILDRSGHRLVDGNERKWPDTMFNDASHLDHKAADEFTRWALDRLQ